MRLIDADKLDVVLRNEAKPFGHGVYECGITDGLALARECVETAPTIYFVGEPIPVRCRDDCYWVRQDCGDDVTPPSAECGKEIKAFDQLNIDPCYGERDETECPDCPFYINHERLIQMESEYHVDEPVLDMPTIDAVPVVRCRECRLHGICSTEDVFRFASLTEENRYCGAGRRREEGDA